MNRSEILHKNFIERLQTGDFPDEAGTREYTGQLPAQALVDIFESQVTSRLLDIISRRLSSRRQSFYTIGSAGHEGNAVFGTVFRQNDIAFLHYRSCAFAIARSKKTPGSTPLYDAMLAFVASAEDPISGGRHKVIGSKSLWIPPQTSTIASHLPKAMGAAHALGLYQKVVHDNIGLDDDNIVICSFGDASVNHSTAQGALNTAAWASYQLSPMPIVFICEDNGIGISTATPRGWIAANFRHKPGIKYIACNGLDIIDTHRAAREAERFVRRTRRPVFLHFKTVRLMGHAGSDIETSYHSNEKIVANEARDPLLYSAALLARHHILTAEQIIGLYRDIEARLTRIAAVAMTRPKLRSAEQISATVWPSGQAREKKLLVDEKERQGLFAKDRRHLGKPVNMARHINLALADIMLQYPNTLVFGEDVAVKGGVYGVTQGLYEKFGKARVTNTVLDEQSILGLAIGLGHCGYLPIPEIQYLAYVHNAEDQIRGEAASLAFFSQGQYANPMVVRIAGFAYQKGFGGHFHNDNAFTVFRDIPGIIVATPSNGQDAAELLRLAVDLAHRENKIVIIIEPIALYMTLDLHEEGDNAWASPYRPPQAQNRFAYGDIRVSGSGRELCILSYANGVYLSEKASKILREEHDVDVRVIDMRWLHPLPEKNLLDAVSDCNNILIVDECRRSGSVSEALFTLFMENGCQARIARLNAEDCFIPLGEAAYEILPSTERIVERALALLERDHHSRRAS